MPTYHYQCATCDLSMTVIRKITDKEINPICVNCAVETKRVYDAPPIQFKGGGWAAKE